MSKDIDDFLDRSLTVKQVRDMLEYVDDDVVVLFSTSYGDFANTEQVLNIDDATDVQSGDLFVSAFSESGIAVDRISGPRLGGPTRPLLIFGRATVDS